MAQSPGTGSAGAQQHPIYALMAATWQKLVHVYDGTGGFLDGTYLVAHPREWKDFTSDTPRTPTKKLKARRALARYENVAALLLDQKRAALFREQPSRTVGDTLDPNRTPHPIEEWWNDVDGAGCSINDWMADSFTWAALFGHLIHYMDRAEALGDVQTAADAPALFLRAYSPLDMPNWVQDDRGALRAVKLVESVPATSIDDPQLNASAYRERVVTDDTWELREYGTLGRSKRTVQLENKTQGPYPHQFGTLPIVVQYAKRQALAPLIGQPVLGDPNLYIDLYNLTSEIRELLRQQTFGILTVKLGSGDNATDIEKAQLMLGTEKGVENVMFTPEGAEYIQPESTNVTVYQQERADLMRTIYRIASVPFESDSKDAEAEGSLQLKREDMNQVLASYGDQCEKAELEIAKLWFRGTYGDSWEREWDAANVQIRYPDTFDVTPFNDILEQTQAASTLPMGPTFMAEQCKRTLSKFMPDLPDDIKQQIEQEIDEQAKASAEMDRKTKEAELKAITQPPGGGFGS